MKLKSLIFSLFVIFTFDACSLAKNKVVTSINDFFKVDSIPTFNSIGEATYDTAYNLTSIEDIKNIQKKSILITSIVDINNINKTSDFGRLYSESIIADLKNKNWNIIDLRNDNVLIMNKNGEFYLNRKVLEVQPKDALIFVATSGKYKDGLLLNQRLIDQNSNIISASSLLLKDNGESTYLNSLDSVNKKDESYTVNIVGDEK